MRAFFSYRSDLSVPSETHLECLIAVVVFQHLPEELDIQYVKRVKQSRSSLGSAGTGAIAQPPAILSLCTARSEPLQSSRASLHLLWEQELQLREGLGDGLTVLVAGPGLEPTPSGSL